MALTIVATTAIKHLRMVVQCLGVGRRDAGLAGVGVVVDLLVDIKVRGRPGDLLAVARPVGLQEHPHHQPIN